MMLTILLLFSCPFPPSGQMILTGEGIWVHEKAKTKSNNYGLTGSNPGAGIPAALIVGLGNKVCKARSLV